MPSPTDSKLHVLHTHSTMSILDGASRVEDYLKYCKKNSLCGCGITDHGYVMGLYDLLSKSAAKNKDKTLKYEGVKPIPGCEFYLIPREDHQFAGEPYPYFHLTIWAKSLVGYRNLITMASRAWQHGRPHQMPYGRKVPRITFDDLKLYAEGLICGSGCIEGPLGKPILRGETLEAIKNAQILSEIFGDRLFFELMPHAVDRNYVRNDIVQVTLEDGSIVRFHPDDIITTPTEQITAAQAVELKPFEIVSASPLRPQEDIMRSELIHLGVTDRGAACPGSPLVGEPLVSVRTRSMTWSLKPGQFLGNECTAERPGGCMQRFANETIARLGRILRGKFLLTLDAHFVDPSEKAVQDILLQNGNADGWRFSTSYYQMDTEQAWEAWQRNHGSMPESEALFIEGVENNTTLVDMIEEIKVPQAFHLPDPDLPIEVSSNESWDYDRKLMQQTMQRIIFHNRLPTEQPARGIYLERLERELAVIAHNPTINFLRYFLIIDQDITGYALEIDEPVGPGRGSAAGCLLAYLLKITHIDPIFWELSFERFLSLGRIRRGKFPDIDMDFGEPKKIVEYLTAKYGDRFARISTTGTVKLKGAMRDVCRILLDTKNDKAMSDRVNSVCMSIDNAPQGVDIKKWMYGYEDDDGNTHKGHLERNPLLQEFFDNYPEVHNMIDRLLDVPRSMGKHASAYCIGDIPLNEIVPMCIIKDEICTQFTMKPVEALGLIKMDLLSLNTLNDIKGALKLIKERKGITIDIYRLTTEPAHPDDKQIGVNICDQRSFDLFGVGRTETVFQFKTPIGTDLCRKVKPQSVLDLANITANGRPGTMDALMEDGKTTLIDAWVERRNGTQRVTYLHPDLEEILEPTQGIFSYQEQIMAAFKKSCGYSEEKADEIREIIGKKQKDKMEEILPDIRTRLSSRGWVDTQIEAFISVCVAASGYSFNKSHSVAYAYIGYVCMWLKTNFCLEWWASVLNNANNQDLKDAARHVGNTVDAPDINLSDLDFYIIDEAKAKLVFPINRIKYVAKAGAAIKSIAPCNSLQDFYERVDKRLSNKRVVISLILAGAFDRICGAQSVLDRNRILSEYLDLRKNKKDERHEYSETELLAKQQELLAIGDADFVEFLKRKTKQSILYPQELANYKDGEAVRFGGMAVRVKHTKTKRDKKPMGFLDLENQSVALSVSVFSQNYPKFKHFMREGAILVVEGRVNDYSGKRGVIADAILEYTEPVDPAEEIEDFAAEA